MEVQLLKKIGGFLLICFFIFSGGLFFHTPQEERDRLIKKQKDSISGLPICAGSPIPFFADAPAIPDEIKVIIEKWDNCVGSYEAEFSGGYSGGWKSGKRHFYGVWSNGEDTYIGGYADGLRQGYGRKLSFLDIQEEGYYEAGKLKSSWWF